MLPVVAEGSARTKLDGSQYAWPESTQDRRRIKKEAIQMKVSGIDYGLGSPWEIEVPDSAMVVEGPNPDRIPRALANPARSVRDALRKPMHMNPLAALVTTPLNLTP